MLPTYTLRNHDMVTSTGNRKYILRIKDLPREDKPREKLLKYGAGALSSQELLAVLFGTGTKKEDLLSMTSRIVREYGERSLASQTNPKTLSEDLGIPLIKATQIVACSELGKRFFQKNAGGVTVIRTAKDVFNYVTDMRTLSKEHLRGLYLNTHHRIIHDEVVSIGTLNANLVHPREVFRPAIAYSAAAIVLAHNHPSGTTKPSQADKEITERLIATGNILGIDLLDHVIITRNKFRSIEAAYE